jgi:hypothetical protein
MRRGREWEFESKVDRKDRMCRIDGIQIRDSEETIQ